jgi:hypothetical protein
MSRASQTGLHDRESNEALRNLRKIYACVSVRMSAQPCSKGEEIRPPHLEFETPFESNRSSSFIDRRAFRECSRGSTSFQSEGLRNRAQYRGD